MPLLFRNILELGERVLAIVDAPLVRLADERAIGNWIPLCVATVGTLFQPKEQPWPPGLRRHEGVMLKVPMEEVAVGVRCQC